VGHDQVVEATWSPPLADDALIWRCVYVNGPIAYPVLTSHDLSVEDGHFTCTPYTYRDLLSDEAKFARAVFKAIEWVDEVP
jgi:hypothetical protein